MSELSKNQQIKELSRWLGKCQDFGWSSKSMKKLADLFWQYHPCVPEKDRITTFTAPKAVQGEGEEIKRQCQNCIGWKNRDKCPGVIDSTLPYVTGCCKDFIATPCKEELSTQSRLEEVLAKYNDLIMGVENKFENESRHEIALRYIKEGGKGSEGAEAHFGKLQ